MGIMKIPISLSLPFFVLCNKAFEWVGGNFFELYFKAGFEGIRRRTYPINVIMDGCTGWPKEELGVEYWTCEMTTLPI